MSRGIESSKTLRSQVVALRRARKTYGEIGTALNMPPRTAQKIYNSWEKTGVYPNRPRSLDKQDLRRLKTYIMKDKTTKRQPLGEIALISSQQRLFINIS
jgi:Homeodomain-like domain